MSLASRWKWAALAALAWLAAGWLGAPDVRGQKDGEKPPEKKAKPGTAATPLYYGVAACNNKGCHGGDPPKRWVDGKDLVCRCVEADEWEAHDKHGEAYKALTGPRGKMMSRNLGYDVTKAKACLTCHAVWIEDEALLKASRSAEFKIEEGVNCVACHGAYEEWVPAHGVLVTARKFRPLSREEKWSKYGMKDLWDPLQRAALCASCHVGNLDEGKFVTHEMYASGHPPLPGLELAAFSNEMPRHWQYLRQKKPAVAAELGYREGEREETKLVLVGAAVSLRETMRLMAAEAATCVKKDDALDLAHFDCYACHHDLKSPSWRQQRGYSGKPGRVPMRPWSAELVRLAAQSAGDHKGDGERLTRLLGDVNKALEARPYGDPPQVEKAAAALATFADGLAGKLKKMEFKADRARRVLAAFPEVFRPDARLIDYDSARQIAWGYEVIHNELKVGDVAANKALQALDESLKLRLLTKKEHLARPEGAWKDDLRRVAEYDPIAGRKLLLGLK